MKSGDVPMMDQVLPSVSTRLGTWVRERFHHDPIAWLTTVDADGVAQPNPVWFLCDGEPILVYNLATARRLVNIRRRPHVTFHLDSHGRDGDAVVLIGVAEIVPEEPPADQNSAFLDRYRKRMDMGPKRWAEYFPVALRIRPTRFRGYHDAGPGRPGVT
jgi:PPOX class probable F420-dependent enzyme